MSRLASFFLLIVAPGLAVLLALLGLETLRSNLLGWFLLLTGIVYTVGIAIDGIIRRDEFWGSKQRVDIIKEERGDRSFWPIAFGLMVVFFLSPLEFLYFAVFQPHTVWMEIIGVGLVLLGSTLFLWARRTLGNQYTGHISIKAIQELVQDGPYRFIRHPAYAGYLFMGLGLALGYSSFWGFVSILFIFLPAVIYRIRVEDQYLAEHFGNQFEKYAQKTKRLIPGIW